jgi:hypothetical protein
MSELKEIYKKINAIFQEHFENSINEERTKLKKMFTPTMEEQIIQDVQMVLSDMPAHLSLDNRNRLLMDIDFIEDRLDLLRRLIK